MESSYFKILSIDGGGIRGIYPAAYLNYFQEQLGKPIHEYFDMIVGTSTGAILALGLALGISAHDILDLYKNKGEKIFKRRIRRVSRGLFLTKYSNKNLFNELKSFFTEERLLGECKTRVCVPSINITSGETIVYKTRHHSEYVDDYKRAVWKVAAASSAAPIFFPAYVDSNLCSYVDGGLWANNPSLVGMAEALKLGYSVDGIKILSIGTGHKIFHKEPRFPHLLGIIGWKWGASLVDVTFQSQSQGANNISRYILKDNFIRIDQRLPDDNKYGLDNVKSIRSLEGFALNKAKETFTEIISQFFNNKVTAFVPVPQ